MESMVVFFMKNDLLALEAVYFFGLYEFREWFLPTDLIRENEFSRFPFLMLLGEPSGEFLS